MHYGKLDNTYVEDCHMNNLLTGHPEALVQGSDGGRLTATVFAYESPVDLAKPKGIARLLLLV